MNKVKAFESTGLEDLEKEINDFLHQLLMQQGSLIDIKYSTVPTAIATHTEYGVYPEVRYTALVVYQLSPQ